MDEINTIKQLISRIKYYSVNLSKSVEEARAKTAEQVVTAEA